MTALTDLVTISHPEKPGISSKVSRAAYRLVWAAEGWACPEDAAWDGTSVLDRVATIETVIAEPIVGPPGPPGADAYQVARDAGYGGTRTQWLASLVGAKGDTGAASTVPGPEGPPGPNLARKVIQNTGALTANTVKNVSVTWPTAMPNTSYAVTATIEGSSPHTVAIGVVSKTTAGCVLAVRSTVNVAAAGLNVNVIGVA